MSEDDKVVLAESGDSISSKLVNSIREIEPSNTSYIVSYSLKDTVINLKPFTFRLSHGVKAVSVMLQISKMLVRVMVITSGQMKALMVEYIDLLVKMPMVNLLFWGRSAFDQPCCAHPANKCLQRELDLLRIPRERLSCCRQDRRNLFS